VDHLDDLDDVLDDGALNAKVADVLAAVLEGQQRIARLLDGVEAAMLLGTGGPLALPNMPAVSGAVTMPADGEPLALVPGETTVLPDGATINLTLRHEVKGGAG